MTEALLDIKHWGNNLGVRLPAAVAREANFHADQRVRVSAEAGRVIISSVDDTPLIPQTKKGSPFLVTP